MKKWFSRLKAFGLTRRALASMLGLGVLCTFFEAIGITIFLPIFQFIRLEGDIEALRESGRVWEIMVDTLDSIGITPDLAGLLLFAFSCFILRQLFLYVRVSYGFRIMMALRKRIIDDGFQRYFAATMAYQDSVPVGTLVNTLVTEGRLSASALMAPITLILHIIISATYLGIMGGLSLEMTAMSVAIFVLTALVLGRWIKHVERLSRLVTKSNSEMTSFLIERLRSPRLIRLSGTTDAELGEMNGLTSQQREHTVDVQLMQARVNTMVEPIIIGLSCAILYIAVSNLDMELEVIGLYLVVGLRLVPVFKTLVDQKQGYLKGMGAIEAIEKAFQEMEENLEIDSGNTRFNRLVDKISIKNVVLRYEQGDSPALNNVNLEISAHKLTALVGPSGSGKSTLIDVISRIRQPQEGEVRFDGTPYEEFSLPSLRSAIAYVPQTPQIFMGTVAQHIRYGKVMASDQEVRKAASLAGAAEFIEKLPNGYETQVGEDGVRLSGGQRQRLDLARALISDASVLILDEPTSNLDAEAEEAFRNVLKAIRQTGDFTIVVVAHRLSTIVEADTIVVLDKGKVASAGSHETLIAENPWYSRAVKLQNL